VSVDSEEAAVAKKRGPQTCKICGEKGHNKLTCPKNVGTKRESSVGRSVGRSHTIDVEVPVKVQIEVEERKLTISTHLLEQVLRQGTQSAVPMNPVPDDVEILDVRMKPMSRGLLVELLLQSKSFYNDAEKFDHAPDWNMLFRHR
jgi:hypothetical protein